MSHAPTENTGASTGEARHGEAERAAASLLGGCCATMGAARPDCGERLMVSLIAAGRVFALGPDRDRLTIGRSERNDLVVADSCVSRDHAEIVRRDGAFYFVDHSSNGTYLRPDGSAPHYLRREEISIEGSGSFSLGWSEGPAIAYAVSVESGLS